jgi:hypothetical protein
MCLMLTPLLSHGTEKKAEAVFVISAECDLHIETLVMKKSAVNNSLGMRIVDKRTGRGYFKPIQITVVSKMDGKEAQVRVQTVEGDGLSSYSFDPGPWRSEDPNSGITGITICRK